MGLPSAGLTQQIIGAGIEVHRHLGPGLLEKAYRRCLVHELRLQGLDVEEEAPIGLHYKGLQLPGCFRLDVVVSQAVVVEVKAVESLLPVHEAQLLTYLRLSGLRAGLLLNFNVPLLKDGIVRRVL